MRRLLYAFPLGLALLTAPLPARAQVAAGSSELSPFFAAPGRYGVAYGYASYGVPVTASAFASPYGAGFANGYAPYGYLPGRYGVGLWRPGYAVPGYAYGASAYRYYRTFPYPFRPYAPPAPLGYYAPSYGSLSSFSGW